MFHLIRRGRGGRKIKHYPLLKTGGEMEK